MGNVFVVGKITTWNEEEELWETKVGTVENDMELWYVVCGKTEEESGMRAVKLLKLLSKYV